MKHTLLLITALLALASAAFGADYDERRILFGENWTHIEKVTLDAVPVLKAQYAAVKKAAESFHADYAQYPLEEPVFYREKAGNAVFYRALFGITDASFPAFAIENLQLFLLERNGKLFLLHTCYLHKRESGDGTVHSYIANTYENITVVKNKDSFDLLEHITRDSEDYYTDPEEYKLWREYSGGGGAVFYRLVDVLKMADSTKAEGTAIPTAQAKPYRFAECGRTLIDPDRPFMYTIQNAFDGDSGTSYVEGSEDDGISMTITEPGGKIKRIGVMNGFAKSEKLYAANNRIQTFTLNGTEHRLSDRHSKDYAYFPAGGSKSVTLRSTSLYKGSSYGDTCIADIAVE